MTKNIIIIILVISCICLLIYANIQANEVKRQTAMAEANLVLAKQHKKAAEAASSEAEKQAANAIHEIKLATAALEECQGLK